VLNISPIISPISIGGFLRIKKRKQKVLIGTIVKFWGFAPYKKLGRVPPKVRPAYKNYTYTTYIHNNFTCLRRHVLEITVRKMKKTVGKQNSTVPRTGIRRVTSKSTENTQ